MPTTKKEKIATIEDKIAQLENQRKQLIQKQKEQERKARTRRLVERARGARLGSVAIVSPNNHTYSFSLTNQARNWYSNPNSNHGIMIMSSNENQVTRVDLASSRNALPVCL